MRLLLIALLFLTISAKALVSDSTVDQQKWLQTKLNNLHKGDTFNLPAGVILTSYLNVNADNVAIVGHNTTLKMSANSTPYHPLIEFWGRKNCMLSGVKIDMSNMTGSIWNGFPAIQIAFSSYIRILNDSIFNNKYVAVRLFGSNDSITITNCLMYKTDACIHVHNTNKRLTFTGNTMIGGTSEGITLYGDSTALVPTDVLIKNNKIYGKANSSGILLVYAKRVNIINNIIKDCNTAIGLAGTDAKASDMTLSTSNIRIINNKFYKNKTLVFKNRVVYNKNITWSNNLTIRR